MNYPLDPNNFPDVSDASDSIYTTLSSNPFESYASSRTSVSDRSSSPTPSVISLTSSLREEAIANEHGRGINTHSEVYRLPADAEEVERLSEPFDSTFYFFAQCFRRRAACHVEDDHGEIPTSSTRSIS
jgi:hypothetical protein